MAEVSAEPRSRNSKRQSSAWSSCTANRALRWWSSGSRFAQTRNVSTLLQQPFQDRLLRVEPIACLLKGVASRAVQYVVGDFLAAVGRQAVQYDGVLRGLRQQSRVQLIRSERLQPVVTLRFLAHARPDIGINHICVAHGLDRIGFGLPRSMCKEAGVEAVSGGRRQPEDRPKLPTCERQ